MDDITKDIIFKKGKTYTNEECDFDFYILKDSKTYKVRTFWGKWRGTFVGTHTILIHKASGFSAGRQYINQPYHDALAWRLK